jgi:hypothetical protein
VHRIVTSAKVNKFFLKVGRKYVAHWQLQEEMGASLLPSVNTSMSQTKRNTLW